MISRIKQEAADLILSSNAARLPDDCYTNMALKDSAM